MLKTRLTAPFLKPGFRPRPICTMQILAMSGGIAALRLTYAAMRTDPELQPEAEAQPGQRERWCPQCGAPSSAIRRWPQSSEVWRAVCTHCHHEWLEAYRRTLSDTLFHSGDLLLFGFLAGVSLVGIGIIAFAFLSLILAAPNTTALIVAVILCLVVAVVIGKLRLGG